MRECSRDAERCDEGERVGVEGEEGPLSRHRSRVHDHSIPRTEALEPNPEPGTSSTLNPEP